MSAAEVVAFCFAGQGAQYVGMGADLGEGAARWADADRALGFSLSALVAHGPEEALTLTENTQPAVFTLGLVHLDMALAEGLVPRVLMGHSLGEYAAWVAAGSLAFEDALRLLQVRGQAMQEAVPVGVGAMSALLSAPTEAVEALCEEIAAARGEILQVALYNCPGNTVVSGQLGAVEEAERQIEARGLGVPQRLSVSAPFHCALLEPAARRLEAALAQVPLRPNALPVIPNVTGKIAAPGTPPEEIRRLLVAQVVSPVRWEASLREALAQGSTRVLSLGPGGMVRSHLKRVSRRFPVWDMDRAADRAQLCAAARESS